MLRLNCKVREQQLLQQLQGAASTGAVPVRLHRLFGYPSQVPVRRTVYEKTRAACIGAKAAAPAAAALEIGRAHV